MADEQALLWDLAGRGAKRARAAERAEMDSVRRKTIKKLRATSQWVTVMRVARQIHQPFTLNDLSVACFKEDPANFGLKGYPHYPDNHRIHYILYGEKGLIAAGLLTRVAQGTFTVAADAEELMNKLRQGSITETEDPA
jgi:hypothetical protein